MDDNNLTRGGKNREKKKRKKKQNMATHSEILHESHRPQTTTIAVAHFLPCFAKKK